ncbi:FeoB-associated Cys-rich membrane protein [bacterium]|nr:FeoB-associated Cys-rich membrane protein [bacterium]
MGFQELIALLIAGSCAVYVIRSVVHSAKKKDCSSCGHKAKSNKVQIELK